MTKTQLHDRTEAQFGKHHDNLQMIVDAMNKGQVQKLVKNEKIKEMFDFFHVDYSKGAS